MSSTQTKSKMIDLYRAFNTPKPTGSKTITKGKKKGMVVEDAHTPVAIGKENVIAFLSGLDENARVDIVLEQSETEKGNSVKSYMVFSPAELSYGVNHVLNGASPKEAAAYLGGSEAFTYPKLFDSTAPSKANVQAIIKAMMDLRATGYDGTSTPERELFDFLDDASGGSTKFDASVLTKITAKVYKHAELSNVKPNERVDVLRNLKEGKHTKLIEELGFDAQKIHREAHGFYFVQQERFKKARDVNGDLVREQGLTLRHYKMVDGVKVLPSYKIKDVKEPVKMEFDRAGFYVNPTRAEVVEKKAAGLEIKASRGRASSSEPKEDSKTKLKLREARDDARKKEAAAKRAETKAEVEKKAQHIVARELGNALK